MSTKSLRKRTYFPLIRLSTSYNHTVLFDGIEEEEEEVEEEEEEEVEEEEEGEGSSSLLTSVMSK